MGDMRAEDLDRGLDNKLRICRAARHVQRAQHIQ
jgi:plasmid stability protein